MQMQVIDRLAAVVPAVDDGPVPLFGKSFLDSDALGGHEQFARQVRVGEIVERGYVTLGNDEYMGRRLRAYIAEREYVIGFVYNVRLDVPIYHLAEQAISHDVFASRFFPNNTGGWPTPKAGRAAFIENWGS
jgi:hypothetical protein